MRIAYALTSLGIAGAEQQVIALAERMAHREHPVRVIVLQERKPEQWLTDLNVDYLEIRNTPLIVSGGLIRTRHALREFQPHLVHSHTYPANMAARLPRFMGVTPAVITTIHSVYEGSRLRMLAFRLTDFLSLHTPPVSCAVAVRFVRLNVVPARKCSAFINTIDVAEFVPDLECRA
jgi:hypothetical protein